jgi:hypothetical protein
MREIVKWALSATALFLFGALAVYVFAVAIGGLE